MPTEEQLIAERLRKRDELLKLGINPYPYRYEPGHRAAELQERYKPLKPGEETQDTAAVAGRLRSIRKMGRLSFATLADGHATIQTALKADILGEQAYDRLRLLDIGDWLGVQGTVFRTKTGELTLQARSYELLCKSTRPLPDKWHGLQDVEQRYRKRHLDLIMNPEVREVFRKRTLIMDAIRSELNRRGFLEVHTPTLQPIYGGAAARPFKTSLHALKMDVYLSISPELYLKRLIVGGLDRVYEFARNFRNEDIDRSHNPEFTSVEAYQAYADFRDMMELTEDLFLAATKAVHGSATFEYQGQKLTVRKPWQSYTVVDAIRKFADIDVNALKDDELYRACERIKRPPMPRDRGHAIMELFDGLVQDKLIQPTFITHHPIESTPLCKPCREPHLQRGFIERFEPFIAGMEVGNAYSELNDPVIQRQRLEEQARQLRGGHAEAHPMDEDFIQAIEHGMPPTGGMAIGIDRMVMLLTDQASIRDVLLFPFMKTMQEGA
jgi:lysyl-tRNA synthetase class 2